MRGIATGIAGVLLAAGVMTQAQAVEIKPDYIGAAFEKAAKSFGAGSIRAGERKCTSDVKYVCSYSLPGNVGMLATADSKEEATTDVILIFASDSEPEFFFTEIGILLGMLNEEISEAERQRIAKKLIEGALDDGATEIANDYWIKSKFIEGVGVFVTAEIAE